MFMQIDNLRSSVPRRRVCCVMSVSDTACYDAATYIDVSIVAHALIIFSHPYHEQRIYLTTDMMLSGTPNI